MEQLTGRKEFDEHLQALEQNLMKLGSMAEDAVTKAIWALAKRDDAMARQIMDNDDALDDLRETINEQALKIIARFQPVALDLRIVSSIMHMATDLERIGDLGVNVAKQCIRMSGQPLIKPLIDLPRMSEQIREMIDAALKAFMNKDVDAAKAVCGMDDEIDDLDSQIFRELLMLMMQNPRNIEQAMLLILVSRNMERAGDHVTNLCEQIVYMATGQTINACDYRRPIEREKDK